jgi:hypoxanthine phosphoribosyltransferase
MRAVSESEHALVTIHSAEAVRERIEALVSQLARDYVEGPSAFVVIAEGARRFAAELVAGLAERGVEPQTIELRARRTRQGTTLGPVKLEAPDPEVFRDKNVLVIDDIADEGRTLEAVLAHVARGEPRSSRVAVLVNKLERRAVRIPIDYLGFEVKSGWVIGFGMDLDGAYRDLDHIAVLAEGS